MDVRLIMATDASTGASKKEIEFAQWVGVQALSFLPFPLATYSYMFSILGYSTLQGIHVTIIQQCFQFWECQLS